MHHWLTRDIMNIIVIHIVEIVILSCIVQSVPGAVKLFNEV